MSLNRKYLLAILILASFGALVFIGKSGMQSEYGNRREMMDVVIGYPKHWGPLNPAQQCTMYGSAVIKNQFESLVRIGPDQLAYPLAAISWKISDDFKVYQFKIDPKKRFSNGEYLKAHHFKEAWEHGLLLAARSHNKSTLDVLSFVKGFEDFEQSRTLSGIKAIDDQTLEIEFKRPYRLALDNLSGARFGVFLKEGKNYLGTGRYIIEETVDRNIINLKKNQYHLEYNDLDDLIIKIVDQSRAKEKLESGEIDVYEYGFLTGLASENCSEQKNESKIVCLRGLEFGHDGLDVNSMEGRFFSKKEHRLALQYIIFSEVLGLDGEKGFIPYSEAEFQISPQVFLPLQKGRILDAEVNNIIFQGKRYVENLALESQLRPLKIYSARNIDWIINILMKYKIHYTPCSGTKDWDSILGMIYKTSDMDLYYGGFSFINGDPDGLYHKFGRNGAILLPMTYSKVVADLLEEGREIIDMGQVDSHYQKVNRAILNEVPVVHLGYSFAISFYRDDKVRYTGVINDRKGNLLHYYRRL